MKKYEYMPIYKYKASQTLKKEDEVTSLYDFATVGSTYNFEKLLDFVRHTAIHELWGFDVEDKNRVLRVYFFKTFQRILEQKKILYSDDGLFCCANTGLMSDKGKDLVFFFTKNTNAERDKEWFLSGIKRVTDDAFLNHFDKIPEVATYTDDIRNMYFDANLQLEVALDHIVDDNWDRVEHIGYPKEVFVPLLEKGIEMTKEKAKRDMHLVVPQLYQNNISFLFPVEFVTPDKRTETICLAVTKISETKYRAMTVYSLEDSYTKCRQLSSLRNTWLYRMLKEKYDASWEAKHAQEIEDANEKEKIALEILDEYVELESVQYGEELANVFKDYIQFKNAKVINDLCNSYEDIEKFTTKYKEWADNCFFFFNRYVKSNGINPGDPNFQTQLENFDNED